MRHSQLQSTVRLLEAGRSRSDEAEVVQNVLGAHLPWHVLMDPQSLDEGAGLDTQFSAAELAASSVFPDQRTKVTEPWEFLLGPELAAQAAPETAVWALQPPRQARRLGTPKSIDDIPLLGRARRRRRWTSAGRISKAAPRPNSTWEAT